VAFSGFFRGGGFGTKNGRGGIIPRMPPSLPRENTHGSVII